MTPENTLPAQVQTTNIRTIHAAADPTVIHWIYTIDSHSSIHTNVITRKKKMTHTTSIIRNRTKILKFPDQKCILITAKHFWIRKKHIVNCMHTNQVQVGKESWITRSFYFLKELGLFSRTIEKNIVCWTIHIGLKTDSRKISE